MKRFLPTLILLLWAIPAFAQVSITGAGKGTPTVAASYCGPGDAGVCNGTAGALVFYSCGRAYNAAYANGTNPLCDLVAVTGGAAVGTLRVKTNGYVDLTAYFAGSVTPAAACAAASGGSCLVSKIYDHLGSANCTGSCDLTVSPGGTTRPPIAFSGATTSLNSLPCVNTASGTQSLVGAGTITSTAAPYSFTIVGKILSANNGRMFVSGALQGGILDNSANLVRMFAGSSLNATADDTKFQTFIGIANTTTTGVMAIDGASTTGTTGTTTINSNIAIGADSSGANTSSIAFCEGGIWSGALNVTNTNSNMRNPTSGWNF